MTAKRTKNKINVVQMNKQPVKQANKTNKTSKQTNQQTQNDGKLQRDACHLDTLKMITLK